MVAEAELVCEQHGLVEVLLRFLGWQGRLCSRHARAVDSEQVVEVGRLHLVALEVLFEDVFGFFRAVHLPHSRTEDINCSIDLSQLKIRSVSQSQLTRAEGFMQPDSSQARVYHWRCLLDRGKDFSQFHGMGQEQFGAELRDGISQRVTLGKGRNYELHKRVQLGSPVSLETVNQFTLSGCGIFLKVHANQNRGHLLYVITAFF